MFLVLLCLDFQSLHIKESKAPHSKIQNKHQIKLKNYNSVKPVLAVHSFSRLPSNKNLSRMYIIY
jgi:hypothetical protein